jgi:hypothetical protein
MEGSIFGEIKTDFVDDKGVIHLDGFKTDDDNEEGTIVGFFINGEIYYRDSEFQFDPYVKEVVAELKAEHEAKPDAVEALKTINSAFHTLVGQVHELLQGDDNQDTYFDEFKEAEDIAKKAIEANS